MALAWPDRAFENDGHYHAIKCMGRQELALLRNEAGWDKHKLWEIDDLKNHRGRWLVGCTKCLRKLA
jgi:hypothetical protein